MDKKTFVFEKIDDIQKATLDLSSHISNANKKATIVTLSGDLGAGKTTFTQKFAEHIGIKNPVVSPTYVIEKIYEINFLNFKQFIHIDAYRLDGAKQLFDIGWEELIKNPEHLIFIEWPEMVSDAIPGDVVQLEFSHGDHENQRKLDIKYYE